MDTVKDTSVRPFRIDIPQASIDDLRARLRVTRYPPALPGDDWHTGFPGAYLREMVEAWHGFDWASYQARLNEVPQFTTVIDGQVIHFVHVTSTEPDAVPLLITHGWPGSFLEFAHLIGPLTDPAAHGADPGAAVHIVIPSPYSPATRSPTVSSGANGSWPTPRSTGSPPAAAPRPTSATPSRADGEICPPIPVSRPPPSSSLTTSASVPSPSPPTRSSGGPTSTTAAATLPPWRNPISLSPTSGSSCATSGTGQWARDRAQHRAAERERRLVMDKTRPSGVRRQGPGIVV